MNNGNSLKLVFLDRDGVINEYPGDGNYVTRVKDFHLIPGSLASLKWLTDAGYAIFIVSNQAGVGKGVYSQAKLDQINNHFLRHVKRVRARVNQVFYCTHRSDAGCDCRKPRIGSIKQAMKLLKKPLVAARQGFFVGDTQIDIEAGKKAGCRTILVLSGRETVRRMKTWPVQPDFVAKNLAAATQIIKNSHENSHRPRVSRSRTHQSRRSAV